MCMAPVMPRWNAPGDAVAPVAMSSALLHCWSETVAPAAMLSIWLPEWHKQLLLQ